VNLTFAEEGAKKAILVTGASSGIGRNIAETLAAQGHFVYAGARKKADLDELNAIDNVMGVRLDVTKQEEIDAVVELISNEHRGLYALINNAGVASSGQLTKTPDSDLHFVFNVNVAGVLRVTRAFAPMIIESQGRIVTTGSIAGIISSARNGVYSMSKHAMEAFADSLAAELAPQGVSVSIVEPGPYKTKIWSTTTDRVMKNMKAAGMTPSEEQKKMVENIATRVLTMKEPDEVSEAVVHALFSNEPRRRYMVVPEERYAEITIRKALEELAQLNQWGPYSYSRDELVKMLDEALAEL
jgi:NAD(P)-dependent dehydrogenase (short-subunit alcohol dehydrogenase family)